MNRKLLCAMSTGVFLLAVLFSGCHVRSVGPDADQGTLIDTDHDDIPNVNDPDIDNDGIPNNADDDIDGDGIVNTADPDIDGDGIANIDDNDIDGDGIINTEDNDIDGDGIVNTADSDIDGDGIANIDDNDIDGDGIVNTADNDIDGDGIINTADSDIDGDGIANGDDADIDGDGIPNSTDPDIDNDGIDNSSDPTPGGTGSDVGGTQGTVNGGSDSDSGVVNTGGDADGGETDNDADVEGIGVVAEDTVGFSIPVPAGQGLGTVSTTELVDLDKVRSSINDNGVDLATFGISNLSIFVPSSPFVQANLQTRVVVTVSYLDENGAKITALESADRAGLAGPVLTVADLAQGVSLNEGIFGTAEGYAGYVALVRDETKKSVSTIIDVTFLDVPQGSGVLPVDFILRAVGTKPF